MTIDYRRECRQMLEAAEQEQTPEWAQAACQRAQAWATLAVAEEIGRLADAMERSAQTPSEPDPEPRYRHDPVPYQENPTYAGLCRKCGASAGDSYCSVPGGSVVA